MKRRGGESHGNRWQWVLAALCCSTTLWAEVSLPAMFTDHLVLQRDRKLNIWGRAGEGETVSVSVNGQQIATTARNGVWQVELAPMPAGGPYELTVTGENTIKIQDVMVGEVWLCSGQSNMEWPLAAAENGREEVARANYPGLRLFQGNTGRTSTSPQEDLPGMRWAVCTPQSARNFSAVAYFFGRELYRELKIPIGVISLTGGGSRLLPWVSYYGLTTEAVWANEAKRWAGWQPDEPSYQQEVSKALADWKTWLAQAEQEVAAGRALPDPPRLPGPLQPGAGGEAGILYNNRVAPWTRYAIRGALWYQGCADVGDGMRYRDKMRSLAASWRHEFKQPELPFYFVQLAPFNYGHPTRLPEMWEAQQAFADEDPHAAMVVTNDIGDFRNIHPPQKEEVGRRLAGLALKREYGRSELVADSPFYQSHKVEGGRMIVTFRNAQTLTTRDGQPARYFELAGADGKFYPARAELSGNQAILTCDQVPAPVHVRYAWRPDVVTNLVNENQLPAGAFRTDRPQQ